MHKRVKRTTQSIDFDWHEHEHCVYAWIIQNVNRNHILCHDRWTNTSGFVAFKTDCYCGVEIVLRGCNDISDPPPMGWTDDGQTAAHAQQSEKPIGISWSMQRSAVLLPLAGD